MSPSEVARQKCLDLLADPNIGLNPYFVSICNAKGIEVLVPGTEGTSTQPFVFPTSDPDFDSPNVMQVDSPIDYLEQVGAIQYPFLMLCAKSAQTEKTPNRRIYGEVFGGQVMLGLTIWVAWGRESLPAGNNFEAHMDALEDALISVLNRDCQKWAPVLYSNRIDFSRTPLATANNGALLRRSLVAQISTTVHLFNPETLP